MQRAGVLNCIVSQYKISKYRLTIPILSINDFAKYIGFAYNCHNSYKLTIVNSYYRFLEIHPKLTQNPKEYLKEIRANNVFSKTFSIGSSLPTFNLKLISKIPYNNNNNQTQVYDITVEENIQSFLANGIVVHNCPGHCLIYKHMKPQRSKDLPIRMAEFGVLHRNEKSGTLHGLTRVRRFQQDDAHIFCRIDQIKTEVLNTLKMLDIIYKLFGLTYTLKLSTRPDKYIGSIDIWNTAESILTEVIKNFSNSDNDVNLKIGDGAFYGPKIDIALLDNLNREIQCGTIQLDFNLPSKERFNLTYINDLDSNDISHPVIIHRAILGSIERFVGIILENNQGRFPVVVSPYPIIIVTIHEQFNPAAMKFKKYVEEELYQNGHRLKIDLDTSSKDIRTKIKNAEKYYYCYIITIGKRESTAILDGESGHGSLGDSEIAIRENTHVKNYKVDDFIKKLLYSCDIIH